jgi:formylmethanofuran dehydrogenase subunit B
MPQVFSDIACTVCGCVCDDLQVTVEGDRIVEARRACRLAEPWFAALSQSLERPAAVVEGEAVSLDAALLRAAEILRSSRAPLVWGLNRSSTAGVRAAVALAERLGGVVDTTSSCHSAATRAMQVVGQSTCSLGEVRNRADLVIFWGADPTTNHPRHLERFSAEPAGLFVPRGRADRTLVVVDSEETATSRLADTFIRIPRDNDFEMAEALRQLLHGDELTALTDVDVPTAQLRELLERMKSCQYGALFFGAGQGDRGRAMVESLLQLTTELNKSTRFTAHYLPKSGGTVGAETALTWLTGFPLAISFAAGYPKYDPIQFAANYLLENSLIDACVLVGSEGVTELTATAQAKLQQLPVICLDYPISKPNVAATVQFTTAIYGVHAPGTAYRMDGIPIPLRQLVPTNYPTDHDVLSAIAARLNR